MNAGHYGTGIIDRIIPYFCGKDRSLYLASCFHSGAVSGPVSAGFPGRGFRGAASIVFAIMVIAGGGRYLP